MPLLLQCDGLAPPRCTDGVMESETELEAVRRAALDAEERAKQAMRDAIATFKESQRHEERAIDTRIQAALTLFAKGE